MNPNFEILKFWHDKFLEFFKNQIEIECILNVVNVLINLRQCWLSFDNLDALVTIYKN